MNNPLNLALRARAELLAYLASHLLAIQLTGEWLALEHVVESTTLWSSVNSGGADVMQRVILSSRALEVALQLEAAPLAAFSAQTITALFCENLRLDFRSEAARTIYRHCLNALIGTRWF